MGEDKKFGRMRMAYSMGDVFIDTQGDLSIRETQLKKLKKMFVTLYQINAERYWERAVTANARQ